MNQDYADICSRCKRPCTRVIRRCFNNLRRYVTACCGAPPVAVRKET